MRIGVTGGVAEGKSTLVRFFREAGFRSFSADEAARIVFEQGQIQRALSGITGLTLPIDRQALRETTFSDDDIRHQVNRVMHRAVFQRMVESDAEVFEIPLLHECALGYWFDETIAVTCGEEIQTERLRMRGHSDVEIGQIVASQLPSRVKIALSDHVIRTETSISSVQNEVSLYTAHFREMYHGSF